MKISIISVGKKHSVDLVDAIKVYEKRLKPQHDLTWQIVAPSIGETLQQKTQESDKIMSLLKSNDFVVLLDESGKIYDNQQLAEVFGKASIEHGCNRLIFIIGGAYGVSQNLKSRANAIWSLSKLVFPHQIVRLILMEQIYRTIMILQNHPYHHQSKTTLVSSG